MSLVDFTVRNFLNEVDSSSPAPGGGSVSALTSAMGVCLTRMVSHLTFNRKQFLELDEKTRSQYEDNFITLNNIKEELIPLVDKDTMAFNQIMEAYKLPKNNEEEIMIRNEQIELATLGAIRVPYEVVRLSHKALEIIEKMMSYGNKNAISDIGVGCLLLHAGLEGAILNVKINLNSLNDQEMVKLYKTSCEKIQLEAKELKERIWQFIISKI